MPSSTRRRLKKMTATAAAIVSLGLGTAALSSQGASAATIPAQPVLHQVTVLGRYTPPASDGSVKPADDGAACGEAYIDYYAIGNKQTVVYSGWTLYGSNYADYFYWDIAVVDSAGVGSRYYYRVPTQQGGGPQYWNIPTGWTNQHSVTGASWSSITEAVINLIGGGQCVFPSLPYNSNTVDIY